MKSEKNFIFCNDSAWCEIRHLLQTEGPHVNICFDHHNNASIYFTGQRMSCDHLQLQGSIAKQFSLCLSISGRELMSIEINNIYSKLIRECLPKSKIKSHREQRTKELLPEKSTRCILMGSKKEFYWQNRLLLDSLIPAY